MGCGEDAEFLGNTGVVLTGVSCTPDPQLARNPLRRKQLKIWLKEVRRNIQYYKLNTL
jgi:hypothetical protein